jgi:hypothetical protein
VVSGWSITAGIAMLSTLSVTLTASSHHPTRWSWTRRDPFCEHLRMIVATSEPRRRG